MIRSSRSGILNHRKWDSSRASALAGKGGFVMKELIFVIFLFAIMPFHNVMAQDIEGVDIHQKMTKSQVIEKFGEPTEYKAFASDDGTLQEIFYYKKGVNRIEFSGGYLSGFSISDNRFTVLKILIPGGVTVGDHLSEVISINPEVKTWRPSKKDIYYIQILDSRVFFIVSEGIITNINFSFPV